MANWTIKTVICTRTAPAGHFAVVQLVNDLYAITINGRCLEVFTWHGGQLQECIEFMMHMAARAMPAPGMPAAAAASSLSSSASASSGHVAPTSPGPSAAA